MANVSVIIPLYNKGKYIQRALDSVLAQTYPDFEVIVVDDGSTDNGPDIVRRYKDSRIRMIQQENAGPGAARNRGTCESKAGFVTYLDADDEWMPTFLEKSVKTLSDNHDCDIISSSFFIGRERINRGEQLREHGITEGPWRLPLDIRQHELSYSLAVFHSCSTVYRREVVEKYGGFYSKNCCSYGEDVYLWLQIMFNHKIYRNTKPLAWYHTDGCGLGLSSGRSAYPIEPSLTDVEPLRRSCPREYQPLLERWLAIHALRSVRLNIELGHMDTAAHLLRAFPLIKSWRVEYLKVKIKMMFPELAPYFRRLKLVSSSLAHIIFQ